jgi:ribosomal protein L17
LTFSVEINSNFSEIFSTIIIVAFKTNIKTVIRLLNDPWHIIMRHQVSGRKLGRTASHRRAMLRNMTTSLVLHERIKTTVEKAKEVRKMAERVVTWGKINNLHHRRLVNSVVQNKEAIFKIFHVLGPRYTFIM